MAAVKNAALEGAQARAEAARRPAPAPIAWGSFVPLLFHVSLTYVCVARSKRR